MTEPARAACVSLADPPAVRQRRVVFLLEVAGGHDALARVLSAFTVLQADLAYVEFRRSQNGAGIRLEVEGLDDRWAQVLARRLERNPEVLGVSLGWRTSG